MRRVIFFIIVFFAINTLITNSAFADDDLSCLVALMRQQNYRDAYDLAQRLAQKTDKNQCPNIIPDLLIGLVDLESGHPEKAIFAFERVLIVDPENCYALYHQGRAYFRVKNYDRAEINFKQLLSYDPPAKFAVPAQNYLWEINCIKPPPPAWEHSFFLFISNGYDTNVNGAPGNDFFEIPILGTVILPGESVEQHDTFTNFYGSAYLTRNFNTSQSITAEMNARHRMNHSLHQFDYSIYSTKVQFSQTIRSFVIQAPIRYEVYTVTSSEHVSRLLSSVGLEVNRTGVNNDVCLGIELQEQNFPTGNLQDAIYAQIYGEWFIHPWEKRLLIHNRLYYVNGIPEQPENDFLVRDYYGLQLSGEWNGIPNHRPFIYLTNQISNFKAEDPTLRQVKNERYYDLAIGWTWTISQNWALQPQYTYSWNRSNVDMFTYNRQIIELELQYRANNSGPCSICRTRDELRSRVR